MLKALWPDYKNCIANLPNSVFQYFGLETVGNTLPMLDEYFKGNYKNVVVILLDGLGVNIINHNLDQKGFFRTHLVDQYSSVFPPTTVAATTSIMSGLMPNEHSWLGWDCYYPQIDKNVAVFSNNEQDTAVPAADYNVAMKYTKYESVFERFKKAGYAAHIASPYVEPFPQTFEEIIERIETLCKQSGEKYIYAYWREPDSTMHRTGCFSGESCLMARELEDKVCKLCDRLKDTIVIVTADHGLIDNKGVAITSYPALMKCLVRMPSIEPRALNLFIKEGKRKQFEEEFQNQFGDKFILLSKQEVLEREVFGTGKDHPSFQSMLGDYLAIATGDVSIFNTVRDAGYFIGVHAGLTQDEMTIPLIISQ